jgi:pyrroloquinoline quinone biosynthesis protein E
MNPELFNIIKYAKQKKTMVKLDTNGTFLSMENIKKILETKIDIISVSIDGVTKKTYERIRIGSNFELVKQNVHELTKERNRTKSQTKVHMFFVLQEKNILDLPKFIQMGNELGVDYIAGSFVVTLGKNENSKNKLFDVKNKKRLIEETKKAIEKSKAEVSVNPLLDYLNSNILDKEFYNAKTPCYMPWYSTFITWDGYVNPCDFSCDNEIVFGNAFEKPFKHIWNNKQIKNFRINLRINRGKIPLCKGCGVDETYLENEINKFKKIPFIKLFRYSQKR